MSKRFILTITTLLFIGLATSLAIFFAKGYTFSPKEKRIVGTGIMTVSSEPDAASIYLDGHLTSATNATIPSLAPKAYSVKIIKEGFIPWEKTVTVKESLVTELKVTLFPAIPTIYPLTFTSVASPLLSPDGSKLAYIVPSGKKMGIWVWSMAKNQPLSFTRSSEPHQVTAGSAIDFSKAELKWSPDSKQILVTLGSTNYLLDSNQLNSEPRDITAVLLATLKSWDDDNKLSDSAKVSAIKDLSLRKVASGAASIKWSPDETKFIIQDKVYNTLELSDKSFTLPAAKSSLWLPDSRHIILVEEGAISLIEYDGTNKAVIFAGSFLDDFVFPWPDSSRLVMISSLPTPTASEPNFYGINLK